MPPRRGVDYSWSRPDPAALAAAGYSFACRYVSTDLRVNGGRTKVIDRAEALALDAAGLDTVLVWEGRAADRDPAAGYGRGVADATEAARQAVLAGMPDGTGLYFAVDWDVTPAELPALAPYFTACAAVLGGPARVGVYGSNRVVRWLFDQGLVGLGWQTYAWSGGLWDPRAQLRQVRNGQTVAGGSVDLNEAHADNFGQWRPTVSTAPADLLAVRSYLRTKTGQSVISLGIVGDAAHLGGYHHGAPDVTATDYSVRESPRDAHPTGNASALDLGGDFPRFREVTLALVSACERKDPRTRDIREVIYTPDGKTVRRWDRLAIRFTGDTSHLTHTHLSLHRDSEGRRDREDNLLGLFREIFDGPPKPATAIGGRSMYRAIRAGTQPVYLVWAGGMIHIQPAANDALAKAGIPLVTCPDDASFAQVMAPSQAIVAPPVTLPPVEVGDDQIQRIIDALVKADTVPVGAVDREAMVEAAQEAMRRGTGAGSP